MKGTDQMGGSVLHESYCGDLTLDVVIIQKKKSLKPVDRWPCAGIALRIVYGVGQSWPLAESSCLPQETGLTSLKPGGVK